MSRKRIYLDYAATTPLDERVKRVMEPFFSEKFGNPSSIHTEGVVAKKAVEEARVKVARALEARAEEIIFTSGGTESNNLAIFGVIRARSAPANFVSCRSPLAGKANEIRWCAERSLHIVTTNIEHSSILESLRELERQGVVEVSYVPVEPNGIVKPEKIISAIRPNTALVSVMLANNEIGTIQPIRKISQLLKRSDLMRPIFHIDACQAPLYLNCLVNALGVDLLTLDAHKIYGPKGIGCLYVRRGTPLAPQLLGGGQERGLRSTTENVPGIVGFAEALRIAVAEREKESARLSALRDHLYSSVLQNTAIRKMGNVIVNGSMEEGERLPNNLNISLPGIDTEMLTLQLDIAGVAVSTKSSCLKDERESYVVRALGVSASRAKSSLRFTLGRGTKKADISAAARALAGSLLNVK